MHRTAFMMQVMNIVFR